jgi:hypothetical protein
LLTVIEVTGKQQGVNLLVETQIDDAHESPPRRIPDQIGKIGVTQGKRTQRRVQMDIRGMDEAVRCDIPLPS